MIIAYRFEVLLQLSQVQTPITHQEAAFKDGVQEWLWGHEVCSRKPMLCFPEAIVLEQGLLVLVLGVDPFKRCPVPIHKSGNLVMGHAAAGINVRKTKNGTRMNHIDNGPVFSRTTPDTSQAPYMVRFTAKGVDAPCQWKSNKQDSVPFHRQDPNLSKIPEITRFSYINLLF